jgi:PAS domain S-box-containing protein
LKVEREVCAREEQLSTLLETAMHAILVLDAGLKVIQVNQAATRLFGCTAEDLVGENLYDFIQAESAARLDAFVKELSAEPPGQSQL